MTNHKNDPTAPESEEWFYLSLHEITYSFDVDPKLIIEIIDEGIVSAKKNSNNELQFDTVAYKRIRTVLRLQHDLGVNLAGAALALELLDEIDRLHKHN